MIKSRQLNFVSLNIKDYFFMSWNSNPRNPFLVSDSCLMTLMSHPAVEMFRVKGGDWETDGRAINKRAQYQVRFFFGQLADEIANACKKIVHGYDNQLYEMAPQTFDQLAENPEFNTRYDVHMRDYKFKPTQQRVVDTYSTGSKVAHYFLRVFRHNQHLNNILGKYHKSWIKGVDLNNTSKESISLRSDLKKFLKRELVEYESFTRNKSEKAVLEKQHSDPVFLDAMHRTLIAMGGDVVLLWWCSEWKNEKLLFFDENGPLKNLLRLQEDAESSVSTTPTLKLGNVELQITDIFSLTTCKSLSRISIDNWISLIKASYEGKLDRYLRWNGSSKHVDPEILENDLLLYEKDYLADQALYRNGNPKIPSWYQLGRQDLSFVPGNHFCVGLQYFGLNTFDEPFITAWNRDWGKGGKRRGGNKPPKGEGGRGFGRQGTGKRAQGGFTFGHQDWKEVDIGRNGGNNSGQSQGRVPARDPGMGY
jgi:hypothetical protein